MKGVCVFVSVCSFSTLILPHLLLRFELAYTHTMYYLAQVYKNLGESDLVCLIPKNTKIHLNVFKQLMRTQFYNFSLS